MEKKILFVGLLAIAVVLFIVYFMLVIAPGPIRIDIEEATDPYTREKFVFEGSTFVVMVESAEGFVVTDGYVEYAGEIKPRVGPEREAPSFTAQYGKEEVRAWGKYKYLADPSNSVEKEFNITRRIKVVKKEEWYCEFMKKTGIRKIDESGILCELNEQEECTCIKKN